MVQVKCIQNYILNELETQINVFLAENADKIEVIDIKYVVLFRQGAQGKHSAMIIYKNL